MSESLHTVSFRLALVFSFLFITTAVWSQLEIKKNHVVVAKKKGIVISYDYNPLKVETLGKQSAGIVEYEFSFLIENTTQDSLQLTSKINFETSVHTTIIELNERLAPREKKAIRKNIVFSEWKQYWVDRPTIEKMKVEKL